MTPRRFLHGFLRDERGSISVEAMLMLPILVWVQIGTFVFFDGFRAASVNVKAAYTIGDALSREPNPVTPEYLDSLFALQEVLTATEEPRRLRVTAIEWDEEGSRYLAVWSQTRGGAQALSTNDLPALRDRLPVLVDGEGIILTETWSDYDPPFAVGIEPFTFHELVVTRPRFASQLCWSANNDPAGWSVNTTIC